MSKHHSVRQGKRVLIILYDGSRFVARFKSKNSGNHQVSFFDHEPVAFRHLRALTIYREPNA